MSKLKFLVVSVCVLSFISAACNAGDSNLAGVNGAVLELSSWDKNSSTWKQVIFTKNNLSFNLYGDGANDSVGVGINSNSLAPNRKYALLQRTVFGVLEDGQKVTQTEKTYCDFVSMETGCVLLSRPADACSGSWKDGEWSTDVGETIRPELETISPDALIQSVVGNSDAKLRALAIKDQMFMGEYSYMSCYPPQKHVRSLNDLGFYLAQGGYDSSALNIYRAIEAVGERAVLMLNIADSLWNMGENAEALQHYKQYSDMMNAEGKGSKVPVRVFQRIKIANP